MDDFPALQYDGMPIDARSRAGRLPTPTGLVSGTISMTEQEDLGAPRAGQGPRAAATAPQQEQPVGQPAVACIHCAHVYDDAFEVLGPGRHEFRCEGCGRPFVAYLCECERCEADVVYVTAPEQEPVAVVRCHRCTAQVALGP